MKNLLKNKGFLFLLILVIVAIFGAIYTNVSAQTAQVKDFKFNATVDCNLNPIEEIGANGVKSLTIYYYPVEFLVKSVTYDHGAVILHDVFLYKHTYKNIYSPSHTEYFDPAEHPENFFQSITIYPQSQVVIKENCNK